MTPYEKRHQAPPVFVGVELPYPDYMPFGRSTLPRASIGESILAAISVEGPESVPDLPMTGMGIFSSPDSVTQNIFSDPRIGFFEAHDALSDLKEQGELNPYLEAIGVDKVSDSSDAVSAVAADVAAAASESSSGSAVAAD